jgi:hypothetical protein
VAQVSVYGSAQSRSRGGSLQPGDLEGLSITSPFRCKTRSGSTRIPYPGLTKWMTSKSRVSVGLRRPTSSRVGIEHMQSIRVRRATVLCGHSDHGSRLITMMLDQLSNWQLKSVESKKKDQVKVAAPPAAVYAVAMRRSDADKWTAAMMEEEKSAFFANGTWKIVPIDPSWNLLSSKSRCSRSRVTNTVILLGTALLLS